MKLKRKNPCNECPFQKDSVQGWLGPWDINSIRYQAMSESGLACHKDVDLNPDAEEHHVCVGSLQHSNVSAKKYHNPELAAFAHIVGKSDNVMNMFEFIKHHTMKVFRASSCHTNNRVKTGIKNVRGM